MGVANSFPKGLKVGENQTQVGIGPCERPIPKKNETFKMPGNLLRAFPGKIGFKGERNNPKPFLPK